MPGPAPKHPDQRARRNATVPLQQLPAAGRQGATPKWPLVDDVELTAKRNHARTLHRAAVRQLDDEGLTKRERSALERKVASSAEQIALLDARLKAQRTLESRLWADMWRTPQSFMWEKAGWDRDVAQYVRHKVLGELGSLDDAKEARAWSDRLGLNPVAMLRLRWEVSATSAGLSAVGSDAPARSSSRSRYAPRAAVSGALASE